MNAINHNIPNAAAPRTNVPMSDVNALKAQLKANNGSVTTMGLNQSNQEHAELRTVGGREVILVSQKTEPSAYPMESWPPKGFALIRSFAIDATDGSVHDLGSSSSLETDKRKPEDPSTVFNGHPELSEEQEAKLKATNFDNSSDMLQTPFSLPSDHHPDGTSNAILRLKITAAADVVAPIINELQGKPSMNLNIDDLTSEEPTRPKVIIPLKFEKLPPSDMPQDVLRDFKSYQEFQPAGKFNNLLWTKPEAEKTLIIDPTTLPPMIGNPTDAK